MTENELTGPRITIPDFDEISHGNAPIRVFIHPADTKEYMLQNDGIAPLSPFSTISGPTNGFTVITALSPDDVLPERNLFANAGPDVEPWLIIAQDTTSAAAATETVWEEFRQWIDAI